MNSSVSNTQRTYLAVKLEFKINKTSYEQTMINNEQLSIPKSNYPNTTTEIETSSKA